MNLLFSLFFFAREKFDFEEKAEKTEPANFQDDIFQVEFMNRICEKNLYR